MDFNNGNENYGGQYGGTKNPNDALFGGMDNAYHMSSSQISYSSLKSSGSNSVVTIAIVVLVLVIVGGIAYAVFGSAMKYNGVYTVQEMEYEGIVITMDQITALTDGEFGGTIEIKGKNAIMDLTDTDRDVSGKCEVEFDGDRVIFKNDGRTLEGTYDKDRKAIILEFTGVKFIFIKED